jgi:hypothetical protein
MLSYREASRRKNTAVNHQLPPTKIGPEKPEPSGMSEPDMQACKRYLNNILCTLVDPSEEQKQELLASIDQLRGKLTL